MNIKLSALDIAVIGGVVAFVAALLAGMVGLWVTGKTAGGWHE